MPYAIHYISKKGCGFLLVFFGNRLFSEERLDKTEKKANV